MKKILFFTMLFVLLIPCVCMAMGTSVNYSYVDDGMLYMGISIDTPVDNSAVYIAVYTKEGNLTDMRKCPLDSDIYNVDVTVSDFDRKDGEVVKLLYLGDNLKPLADSTCYGAGDKYLTGVIAATPLMSDYGLASDEVEVLITESHGYEMFDNIHYNYVFEHCIPDIDRFYGKNVNMYLEKLSNGGYRIVNILPCEGFSEIQMVKGDIESIEAGILRYYESEEAVKTTKLRLNEHDFTVVVNNVMAEISDVFSYRVSDEAEVTLIENTGDSDYDLMIVKDYSYDIVDDVDAAKNSFTTFYNTGRFTFDFEDTDVVHSILNKYGEPITLADFKKGDVIAYILDYGSKTAGDYMWIEIINLGQNAVSGTVTEINMNSGDVWIDGVRYETVSQLYGPNVNETGKFYLTKSNKIFSIELIDLSAENYAYILDMEEAATTFENKWLVKLLTRDGSVEIYEMADTVSIDGISIKSETATWDDWGFLSCIRDANSFKDYVESRFVVCKLNSENKIRQIMSNDIIWAYGEFNASAVAVGSNLISENAVVFNLISESEERAFVTDLSSLNHESRYEGFLIRNADMEYNAFVITAGSGNIKLSQDIAIVDSVNCITLNDDDAWKVKYYTSGDDTLRETIITADTSVEYSTDDVYQIGSNLKKGDVILLYDDENGVALSIAWLAQVDYAHYNTLIPSIDEDVAFVTGYIEEIRNTSNSTNIITGDDYFLTIRESVNAYTYDYKTARNVSIVVGDWLAGNVDVFDWETGEASYFFAVVENGIVTDIITHGVRSYAEYYSLYSGMEADLFSTDSRISYSTSGAYLKGVVAGTAMTGDFGLASNEVAVLVYDCCGGNEYFDDILGEYVVFKHNVPAINDYYGMEVKIFPEDLDSGKFTIADISVADNNVIKLERSSIDTLRSGELKYYETETSTKTTNIKLDRGIEVIINNEARTIDDIWGRVGDEAELTVIENTGDDKYDLILVKDYRYDIIDEVDAEKSKFTLANTTGSFTFDFDDTDVVYSIVNKDGEPITLEDFNRGDVIAYILDNGSKTAGNYDWIEIINLGQNSVSGSVTEVDASLWAVWIDGDMYGTVSDFMLPSVNETGKFYLTKSNKIFGMELAPTVNNYAYILGMGEKATAFENKWQVKLLTKDGSVVVYDMADTFVVEGNGDYRTVKAETARWEDLGFLANLQNSHFKDNAESRIITYMLNSQGEIVQIKAVPGIVALGSSETLMEYNGTVGIIGGKVLEEDAVIFNLVSDSVDECHASDISCLVHENAYSGYLVLNQDYEYDAMFILAGEECSHEGDEPVEELSDEKQAYILNADLSADTFSQKWQFKLLTSEGNVEIYDVAKRFSVNGLMHQQDDFAIGGLEAVVSPAFNVNVENRLITYRLNSNGEIAEIVNVNNGFSYTDVYAEYNSDLRMLGGTVLEENTVVYNLASDSEKNIFVTDITSLINGNAYCGYVKENSDGKYDTLVVTAVESYIDYTQDISIVESINMVSYNDDEAWKIRYYTSNEAELKELIVTYDTISECSGGYIEDDMYSLSKGSVFMFSADENGVATSFVWIAMYDGPNFPYILNDEAVNRINSRDGINFVSGYITDIKKQNNGTEIIYSENGDLVPVTGDTNAYTFEFATWSKMAITPGNWQASNSVDVFDGDTATYFIAVVKDGIASDIVTYSPRVAIN